MQVPHNALRPFDRSAYLIADLSYDPNDGTIDVLLMKTGDSRVTLTWRTNPDESWREQGIWEELHYVLTGTDWDSGALAANSQNFAEWLGARRRRYGGAYVWPMVETFHEGPQVVGFWSSGDQARALAPLGISYGEWRKRGLCPRHQPSGRQAWRAEAERTKRLLAETAAQIAAQDPPPTFTVTESHDPYVEHRVAHEVAGREREGTRLALPHDLIAVRPTLTLHFEIQHEDYV